MINIRPLAIMAAKEVEELVAAGMAFERAVQRVRPKYASAVKKLKRLQSARYKLGGTK